MSLKDLLGGITTRDFLAIELATSLVALVFVLAIKAPDSDAFKVLLGAMLSTGFTSAIGYYFNTSKGSDDKNKTIDTAVANAINTQPPSVVTTTKTEAPPLGEHGPATTTTETRPAPPPTETKPAAP